MKSYRIALIACILLATLGLGCKKDVPEEPSPMESEDSPTLIDDPRYSLEAPDDVFDEFSGASASVSGDLRSYMNDNSVLFKLKIPNSWSGDGPVWRPKEDDKINHIRVAFFPGSGPSTSWKQQVDSDAHEVIHAEEREKDFFLLVNSEILKASILKIFIPTETGQEHAFFECRIGYDADRPLMWNACRTALESLEVGMQE